MTVARLCVLEREGWCRSRSRAAHREIGDLVDGACEQVALWGYDLAHRDELALKGEQSLELVLGGVGQHRGFESVDLVVHVGE
jgi:hypothetical protein